MTNIPVKPPPRPGLLTRLNDYAARAVRGQLHLPPWWLRDVGGGDFEVTGREFLRLFIELAHLQPTEQILEIGCGSGRMALPLTGYLTQAGSYTGMDITLESIHWCQRHITRRYPNFRFLHADLYNQRYNPQGQHQAKDYHFPFEDNSFGFIFLTSVFTHLLPEDAEHYLREVCRLLRGNGLAFMTFFLLNESQQRLAAQGQNSIDFRYGSGPYRTRSEITPESAVAYDEVFLRQLIAQCGLQLIEPARYGAWSGRSDGLSYQDILLVRLGGS
ncbi:MAG: class I SAM-dependent methyltransferase [Anaerolineales bacterium]|nr:class I SAM-dependent methyltransferase [Anaerolineales bacterium]